MKLDNQFIMRIAPKVVLFLAAFGSPAMADLPCFNPSNLTFEGGPFSDGDTLHVVALQPQGFAPVLEGAGYVLSGYRYNSQVPTANNPEGVGKDRIHRSCYRIGAPLPGTPGTYAIDLDRSLPSGDYRLGIVRSCPQDFQDDLDSEVCESSHSFLKTPSYLIATLNRVEVISNSEDPENHPAELRFQFAGFSGVPQISGNSNTARAAISGNYPGGPKGEGHATHADGTDLFPDLPVFVGLQSRLFLSACQKEANSWPMSQALSLASECESDQSDGLFTDHIELGVSAVEFDDSGPTVWDEVAAVHLTALQCAVKVSAAAVASGGSGAGAAGFECAAGAAGVYGKIHTFINEILVDNDDDHLGTAKYAKQKIDGANAFPLTNEVGDGPIDFEGGGNRLKAWFDLQETGGLMLSDYQINLLQTEVIEGYEVFSGCKPPDELVAVVRGMGLENSVYPNGTRVAISADSLDQFGNLDVPITVLKSQFPPRSARETPGVYLEMSFWDDDGEKQSDLLGRVSVTYLWQDLFAGKLNDDPSLATDIRFTESVDARGIETLSAVAVFRKQAHGYEGSDKACRNPNLSSDTVIANGLDMNGERGRVEIVYSIRATWLKAVRP